MSSGDMLGADAYSARAARLFRASVGIFCLALIALPFPSRAAAKDSAKFRKEVEALFADRTLLRLELEISEPGMDSLRRDPRTYVRATLRDGNKTNHNVGVHLKGAAGSFRRVDDRPGLTLNFDYFMPDSPRFHGLKKVHLNNSVQDPSRLSELVAGQMFREAGVPSARAAHAVVELNGRPLGLYVVLEAMNKDFLAQYFKNTKGNLYGQPRKGDVNEYLERMEGEGPDTGQDLSALAAALWEQNPKLRLERIEKTLDVDRFLSFMALETILCHWDGYTLARHNYRVYHDLDTGRMVFFPHDLDQLLVRPNASLIPRASGLVAEAVLDTPALRSRYQQRVCDLATNLFDASRWTRRVDQAVSALGPALQAYDADIAHAFTGMAESFKSRISNRELQLEKQAAILTAAARPLKFSNDIARLTQWTTENWQPSTRLERVRDDDGRPTLWISAGRPPGASWRTQVLLEAGHYRFEGLARCAGVDSSFGRRGGGAGLSVPGYRRTGSSTLTGDSPWQKLTCEFDLTATEEVELVCELRAIRGEVWFDAGSLQLVRVK